MPRSVPQNSTTMKNVFGHKIHTLVQQFTGGWQGYVGVPPEHILYGKHYTEIIPEWEQEEDTFDGFVESRGILNIMASMNKAEDGFHPLSMQFSVHGGITYSGPAYWDQEKYIPKNFTPELGKYTKAKRLMWRCGNELFSHYRNMGVKVHEYRHGEQWKLKEKIQSDPLFARAWRVRQVYENLKSYPKPQMDNFLNWQWGYNAKEDFFYATSDDYWYFGWDCNHYGDTASDFPHERAVEETTQLSHQLFNYDNERNRYFMAEVPVE